MVDSTSVSTTRTSKRATGPSWNQRESTAYVACFLAALSFAGLALHDVRRQHWLSEEAAEKALLSRLMPVNASVLLRKRTQFRGEQSAPFTLVEFGDYECPPCRATQKLLAAFMAKYASRVRMDYRQYPLTQLHPHAQAAAIAAESAYLSNKLWEIHDRLFVTDFTKRDAVHKVSAQLHLPQNNPSARKQLATDITLANQIGVTGTPSFVLCCPDGKVFWIPSLTEIDPFIGQYDSNNREAISRSKSQAAPGDIPKCGGNGGPAGCVP